MFCVSKVAYQLEYKIFLYKNNQFIKFIYNKICSSNNSLVKANLWSYTDVVIINLLFWLIVGMWLINVKLQNNLTWACIGVCGVGGAEGGGLRFESLEGSFKFLEESFTYIMIN